jgi:hypothetical protein
MGILEGIFYRKLCLSKIPPLARKTMKKEFLRTTED